VGHFHKLFQSSLAKLINSVSGLVKEKSIGTLSNIAFKCTPGLRGFLNRWEICSDSCVCVCVCVCVCSPTEKQMCV
jgi:hypothetical protein